MTHTRRNLGYTIDQTILIVAIIAILITLVIATVGWDLINRSGGTKLAAQLRQVEDSVGQFYAQHQVWPHQASTNVNNANEIPRVLANLGAGYTLAPNVDATKMRNYISGFERTGNDLYHDFGATGRIYMQVNNPASATGLSTNQYLILQLNSVPINEVIEADEIIDGTESATVGRFIYRSSGNCYTGAGAAVSAGTSEVNACYIANIIQ